MTLFADARLSARIERLAAEELRRFVATSQSLDPLSSARVLDIAGGVAAYLGPGSPVNQAVGLGFDGPVTDDDSASLEAFYAQRGQRGLATVSPLADRSLHARLSARGWTVDGFENVLVRPYVSCERFENAGEVEVVETTDDDGRALWVHIAAIAFSAPLEPLAAQLELGRIVVARPGTRTYVAFIDGRPAGTGELYIEDSVAWLSADSTLPQFRRRGVQRALQARRLAIGAELGCEIAVSESAPGSGSQRNMERLGFSVAYTRADLVAPKAQGKEQE